jgi:hypothetical protein
VALDAAAAIDAIRGWVGSKADDPTDASIARAYERLGSVEAAALEFLRRRRADFLRDPAKYGLEGDASWDASENLRQLNADIERLESVVGRTGGVTVGRLVRSGARR